MNPSKSQDTANESEFTVIKQAAMQIELAADPDQAIYNILSICSRQMGLNRGRVFLKEANSDWLFAAYSYGLTPLEIERSRFHLKEGITGKVMATGQAAVVPDIDLEEDYLFRTVDRAALPQEPVAFFALPLIRKQKTVGVLTFNRLKNRQRSYDRDLAFLKIMATFISEILAVHQLIEQQTQHLKHENEQLRQVALGQGSQYGIIGESLALTQALDKAARAAATPVTVMLKGESGTGKEKFSRMVHRASHRKDGPFIAINCAAIPKDLIEAELFGYEKGSFTGAHQQKKGKFELANKGTLFLDEIGDLDLDLQSKLLRVLEEKSVTRLGGVEPVALDVRIIVASHKDLQQAVNDGRFRLDLFYRLNVFPIDLPPLRERHGDVRILARHFLDLTNQDYHSNVVLARETLGYFEQYDWPGNIRQLENVIKRAVLMANEHGIVSVATIQNILNDERGITHDTDMTKGQAPTPLMQSQLTPPVQDFQQHTTDTLTRSYWKVNQEDADMLQAALKQARGNKTRAAKLLNMTPRQLSYRLEKLGI
ncbi:hydrogenase [Thiomicrospira aerophila AL3]|uniref:Hydrogenase n=1 Tax=Thiomicrospira aerophila AL3 TaxID=717772 RepID=W0DX31_9GAMM|nr:sigma-54-dependent Fis family transcriptional regulator [Thiomicrospira aerophila]AHF01539.1 hydrogenase [Thiomicrospira aerophila AL3]